MYMQFRVMLSARWMHTRMRGLVWVAVESIADVDAKPQEKVFVVDHASVVEVVTLIQPKYNHVVAKFYNHVLR